MAHPVSTMSAMGARATRLGQQVQRLRQWDAGAGRRADAATRHRFLAVVHRAQAVAHQIAAAAMTARAGPAGRANPQLTPLLAGTQRILQALSGLARAPGSAGPAAGPPPLAPRPGVLPAGMPAARPPGLAPSLARAPMAPPRPAPIDAPRRGPPRLGPGGAGPRGPALDPLSALEREFPELAEAEADHAMGGTDKRTQRNKQEAVRVDRQRTDRAQQRVKGAEDRQRGREASLARIRQLSNSAFSRGVTMIVVPTPIATPEIIRRLTSYASSAFVQQIAALLSEPQGSGSVGPTVVSAIVASSISSAATNLKIIDEVNAPAIAKAVNDILSSELPPLLKVIGTALAVGTGKKSGGKPGAGKAK